MKKSLLSLAMLVGLGGHAQAENLENTVEKQSVQKASVQKASRTSAVDEIVTGEFKGINIEVVSHQQHEYVFASDEDNAKFQKYAEQVAERNNWPQEVAKDITSRAMVYSVIKDNSKAAEAFSQTDRAYENQLSSDLHYIEEYGAEAYMRNKLHQEPTKGKTIHFEEVRKNLKSFHETASGLKYYIEGSQIAYQGTVNGLQANKLLPRYSSEKSDKVDPRGFYMAYKNKDGKYQCGGSVAANANMAQFKERQMLQLLCINDDICNDMQKRQNNGEQLSDIELNFMSKHKAQLKKRGLAHDSNGNLTAVQQGVSKQQERGR